MKTGSSDKSSTDCRTLDISLAASGCCPSCEKPLQSVKITGEVISCPFCGKPVNLSMARPVGSNCCYMAMVALASMMIAMFLVFWLDRAKTGYKWPGPFDLDYWSSLLGWLRTYSDNVSAVAGIIGVLLLFALLIWNRRWRRLSFGKSLMLVAFMSVVVLLFWLACTYMPYRE